MNIWDGKKVLVTGGASFIGSHLCEALLERGAIVECIDDLSSGKVENMLGFIQNPNFKFVPIDIRLWMKAFHEKDTVFHLAATHGGRGFVDKQQVGCSKNLGLDSTVFDFCHRAGVKEIVYASSGCVYPTSFQDSTHRAVLLMEEDAGPPYEADQMYGWAKLMAEMTLEAYRKEYGIRTVSCRYFTVYGPRGKEDHAVMAMIGRAFLKQTPFEIWGDGTQIRNWTYVDDIVDGTILAAEHPEGGPYNLGTEEATTVDQCAKMIFEITNFHPNIRYLLDKPTGPMNRVASCERARGLLDWRPRSFISGLCDTIEWYYKTKTREEVEKIFDDGSIIEGRSR